MSDHPGAPAEAPPHQPGLQQPLWFLVVYALAWAGGSIAYVPFLTILLPVRIAALVPQQQAVLWLSAIAFCGAISASIGHILFGWLSDVTGVRRPWAALGLALSCLLLLLVPRRAVRGSELATVGLMAVVVLCLFIDLAVSRPKLSQVRV